MDIDKILAGLKIKKGWMMGGFRYYNEPGPHGAWAEVRRCPDRERFNIRETTPTGRHHPIGGGECVARQWDSGLSAEVIDDWYRSRGWSRDIRYDFAGGPQ